MNKKFLATFLAAAMALSLTACGTSPQSTNSQASSQQANSASLPTAAVDLQDEANIDNTVQRDSITIAWQAATTLAPWGTNNDTPGNYEVYEMLYECTSDGQRYGVLADESKGSYAPGCDHEEGTGIYTVYIYDYIKDHAGNSVTASDVAFSYNHQVQL